MLDPELIEQLAGALGTEAGLIEKDWHVTRALGVLATIQHDRIKPTFSGGISLSKGWGLIKRFSEDIDFKVAGDTDRNARRAYRESVMTTLQASGFELQGEPVVRDSSRFFSANFSYPSQFRIGPGLRPHLRVEMSFHTPALPAVTRPLQSMIGKALKESPEVSAFPCVDPVETAADKLSALAWRVCTRQRGTDDDDPTVIRHLHDLAALEQLATASAAFRNLVLQAAAADSNRGGGTAPASPADRFAAMLHQLETDAAWAAEYNDYVHQVSFAQPEEIIAFGQALEAAKRLINALFEQATPI